MNHNFFYKIQGEKGVADVLGILRDELSQTMALAGCRSIEEINRDMT